MPSLLATLGALLTLALPTAVVRAQDQIGPDILVPQRYLVRPGVVEVKSVDVDVDVVDQVATTHMAITLHNPTQSNREAQLVLPVPADAAIRSFGLDSINAEPNAILLPKDKADQIYRDIVRKLADPGLLEFVGTGLIQSSVFPVPAGEEATFRVVYEHALPAEAGRVDYSLLRSESMITSGIEWKINLRLRSSRPIGLIYSPTHALDEKRTSDKDVSIRVLGTEDPGPFRMSYVATDLGQAAITTLLYPDPRVADGRGGYFMLFLNAPEKADAKPMPREVTLVLDRSGSMRGEKLEQAKAAALQIIEALNDGERFNIIDYSDTIARFSQNTVEKDDQAVAKARAYIEHIKSLGGTNIHDALLEAVRQKPSDGMLPMVLFLTDGLPTVGPTSESVIRDAVEKANQYDRRIFTFGVGYDVNAPLLTALAQQSRAAVTFVEPREDVEVKVGRTFAKLAGPVLASPELRSITADLSIDTPRIREQMPAELPDLFSGEQMIVLGQYLSDEPMTLQISGDQSGKTRSFTTQLNPKDASSANSFVARLWAQRKIASLIDAIRQAGADGKMRESDPKYKELVDEVVALSQEYGILTEYTAFIAVEDAYKQNLAQDGAVQYRLGMRMLSDRSGQSGVSLESNNQARQRDGRVSAPAFELDSSLQSTPSSAAAPAGEIGDLPVFKTSQDAARTIQNLAGRTFYLRGDRWVQSDLLDKPDQEPDREVAFGTDAYDKLTDQLIDADLQAVLGLNARQDVYLLFNGENILLRKPAE